MAINERLKDVVLGAMYEILASDPDPLVPMRGNKEEKISQIEEMTHIDIDSDYKIRMKFLNLIGYGYDFEKKEDASRIYKNAVEKTEELRGIPGIEELISNGIAGKTIGWYVTKI